MSFQTRSPPPFSTSSHEDWDLRNKMSKTSSATYSVTSSSSRQTNVSVQEASAKQYFIELQKYLASMLEKEAVDGAPSQRMAARQKLSRLSNIQFHELATDVYDEMIRRTSDKHRSFLPVKDDFHPRRNQARQKLATLQNTRFKDLASDVYHELKRRYPQIDEQPPLSDPQGLPSQSINLIPNKGMMSVESIDFSDEEGQSPVVVNNQSLDSLMEDLGNMVKTPKHEIQSNPFDSTDNVEKIKYEYEKKIEDMTKRMKMLELALNNDINSPNSPGSQSDKERQIRMRQMHDEYRNLDVRYSQLNKEHTEQQKAVHEVKQEMKQLIDELKDLSSKNEALRVQNEKAETQIRALTQENKSWKRKYETVSMELRSFKVKSVSLENNGLAKEFFLKPNPKGAIGQQSVIEYQAAIDDLMKTSRSSKPSEVLFSMRNIVMACKSITTEVEDYEIKVGLISEHQESLYEIKRKFSNELTSLLTATKSFASGMGISPVSLVDAAASNLTSTIVELVKLLGMRSLQDNEDGVQSLSILKNEERILNNNTQTQIDVMIPSKLSEFLKLETDNIISSVQNLLSALRSNDRNLYEIITSIINIVSEIIITSKKTFSTDDGMKYQKQGYIILDDLDKCNKKIIQIRDSAFTNPHENANAIAKRNLAQESYEIAKYTKELISMLDM